MMFSICQLSQINVEFGSHCKIFFSKKYRISQRDGNKLGSSCQQNPVGQQHINKACIERCVLYI